MCMTAYTPQSTNRIRCSGARKYLSAISHDLPLSLSVFHRVWSPPGMADQLRFASPPYISVLRHSRCLSFSGQSVSVSTSCFLCDLCGASLPLGRGLPSFHTSVYTMATNNSSKRPATTLHCGNIEATIWQNVSEKGPFFATTFLRPFKDRAGEWRNGTSSGLMTLSLL